MTRPQRIPGGPGAGTFDLASSSVALRWAQTYGGRCDPTSVENTNRCWLFEKYTGQALAWLGYGSGRRKLKVVPWPGSLSTQIVPPWRLTISWLM
jgi:hypothetical protein